ncbi:hypothetical protein [Thioalkalivibrio sp. ALE12]|uniref:hypothetical protein n=1 Tax=Thioalkalivibrio sp. ALE12 TaxID=1158170 RepID=UPI00036CE1F4|nr:hypothetical protein [Thioalkalivibrio sp. ALE12]
MNSCHNHAPRDGVSVSLVNNGYTDDGRLRQRYHTTAWSAEAQCVHGGHPESDPGCEGCRWRPNPQEVAA